MSSKKIQPVMVFADAEGNVYDHPDLLMLVRRGRERSVLDVVGFLRGRHAAQHGQRLADSERCDQREERAGLMGEPERDRRRRKHGPDTEPRLKKNSRKQQMRAALQVGAARQQKKPRDGDQQQIGAEPVIELRGGGTPISTPSRR